MDRKNNKSKQIPQRQKSYKGLWITAICSVCIVVGVIANFLNSNLYTKMQALYYGEKFLESKDYDSASGLFVAAYQLYPDEKELYDKVIDVYMKRISAQLEQSLYNDALASAKEGFEYTKSDVLDEQVRNIEELIAKIDRKTYNAEQWKREKEAFDKQWVKNKEEWERAQELGKTIQ